MLAGDPTPFYERNGYVKDQPDPERPHIIDMVRPNGAGPAAAPQGLVAPQFTSPAASRAVGVGDSASIVPAAVTPIATPTPQAAGPSLADGNHVVLTLQQYNELATLKKNRERIAAYRAKRKGELNGATPAAPWQPHQSV